MVIAENKNFVGLSICPSPLDLDTLSEAHTFALIVPTPGGEALLQSPPSFLAKPLQKPRILLNAHDPAAEKMMGDWIASEEGAKVWWEDIGLADESEK